MIDFSDFYQAIAKNRLQHWLTTLPSLLSNWQKEHQHGDFPRWQKVLTKLPQVTTRHIEIQDSVTLGQEGELTEGERKRTENLFRHLQPWRKGPYQVHGIHIDTEWRSDLKWDRLTPHISPLKGRYVLDVGCGSGYHMWRMLGAGAEFVTGVDPSALFLCQFEAIRHFANAEQKIHLLPLGIQELPPLKAFDTLFSMGVLYHRRSPIDHLMQLKSHLKPGGELVLETLVIPGDEQDVLVPIDRYAKMRNIWFIPSSKALKLWLEKCGFEQVTIADETPTTFEEQRKTNWINTESLDDFLDPNDPSKTIEGYPAPLRALLIAKAPYKVD
ncbi:tRNA 5-methoxyuridine(34)/uridine 5-oxyacetic acid(34) synthase CmoB [Dongshaea marina]|uniref:tRNA 5-methoxyuridine(34)/uridine 5-oxyacetic acid(34) synthase CmoB n=1 Tax=Dongshaea marina TaxID=2047966 RepID=UPI000D3EB726|nr:tRNA 5-methoxyuridine(34)/uridine 5-oxyacetic acid(34) synthase CmoB [Dongshaea marina]